MQCRTVFPPHVYIPLRMVFFPEESEHNSGVMEHWGLLFHRLDLGHIDWPGLSGMEALVREAWVSDHAGRPLASWVLVDTGRAKCS